MAEATPAKGVTSERTLAGHTELVRSLDFSADGALLASGSFDKSVRIWDVQTGKSLRQLTGHGKGVSKVGFVPHTQILASASSDRHIRLWDVPTGQCRSVLGPHGGFFLGGGGSLALSPDGEYVLSTGSRTFRVWSVTTGHVVAECRHSESLAEGCVSVCYSPDGVAVYSASKGHIKAWSTESWQDLGEIAYSQRGNQDLKASPQGGLIAAITWNPLDVWDVRSRKLQTQIDIENTVSLDAVFASRGQQILVAAGIGGVGAWHTQTGKKEWSHKTEDVAASIAVSRNEDLVAVGYGNGEIKVGRLSV